MKYSRRVIGTNIWALMEEQHINQKQLAIDLGYSFRDVCRLIEGRLLLAPEELQRVAERLHTTQAELLSCENRENKTPVFEYMQKFSDVSNLDKVLDLLDEYVELKESL